MDNVSGMLGLGGANQSKEDRKQRLMQSIQHQQSLENVRILVEKIGENCFESCVPKPGPSLSTTETMCLKNCMSKYMAAWNEVSQAFIQRIKSDPSSA